MSISLNEETRRFIREHSNKDVSTLALQAKKEVNVDIAAALTQIAGRQMAAEKVPSWHSIEEIQYPPHLSLEQCSSEATAGYKADILFRQKSTHTSLTDLTGGFGIDCAFLARLFQQVSYVERQKILCEIAAHNFPLLGLKHIQIFCKDGEQHLQDMSPVDWIFIDPARRDAHGGKTISIADCEPNVAALETHLLEKAQQVLIKLSPMLDLSLALQDMKQVQEAHIVSVHNECKELLLVLGHGQTSPEATPIYCVNLLGKEVKQQTVFTRQQEQESICEYTSALGNYLYEPNASLLKAGAFRSLAAQYSIKKLHPNSHLYTSETLIADFPGRKFQITASSTLNKKELKLLLGAERKANLTVRNFPASVAELRKRLKLAEGGSTYLFATTLSDDKKVLIRCEQLLIP